MESCDLPGSSTAEQAEEKTLRPLLDTFKYLQRKSGELLNYLFYRQDCIRREQFSLALPVLIRVSQPFLLYLESVARDRSFKNRAMPESLQRKLLDISQQLVGHLEQLSLMYESLGFISLDDTDPGGMACALCGKFALGTSCVVSIFRYFMPALYSYGHRTLYKKLRWNVEVSEEITQGREPNITYYFLCYREIALDSPCPLDAMCGTQRSSSAPSDMHKLWSIGIWVPLEPASDTDVLSWILCSQPSGWYHKLLTVGFHEPSHTAATDRLVQILTNPDAGGMTSQANPIVQSPLPVSNVPSLPNTTNQVSSSDLEGYDPFTAKE